MGLGIPFPHNKKYALIFNIDQLIPITVNNCPLVLVKINDNGVALNPNS